MPQTPNSRRNLDAAIRRYSGEGTGYLHTRAIIANAVVGQMLPSGVVKGGSALKLRFGDASTRFTTDLDAARTDDLALFISEFEDRLVKGWSGFTGYIVQRTPAQPKDVPAQYVMQPFDVKLSYNGKSWLTVSLEVGHNEIGDADEADLTISSDVVNLFNEIGLPTPQPIPLMPLHYQIAQKIHGVTEPSSMRVHDLIDLQIIMARGSIDLSQVRETCIRLFAYRKMQQWPCKVIVGDEWESLYNEQAEGLSVLSTVGAACKWLNNMIDNIESAKIKN